MTLADDPIEDHGRIGYGRYSRYSPVALAVVIVVALVLIGIFQQGDSDETDRRVSALAGTTAPDVTLTLFDGTPLRLADLRGNVVVLNFWAEWCAPCKNEAPLLQAVGAEAQATDDAIAVVGVDIKNDNPEKAQAFIADHGLTYPIGRDTGGADPVIGAIQSAFGITTLMPTTVFIRPDGVIDDAYIGEMDEDLLREYIAAARGDG